MKKIFNFSSAFIAVAMCVFMISSCAKKADNPTVDQMCQLFNDMASKIQKCNNLDELQDLDFSDAIKKIDSRDLTAEDLKAELTEGDKELLKASFDNLMDAVAEKSVEFGEGQVERSDVESMMEYVKKPVVQAIDKSKTLGDLVDNFNRLGY